MKLVVFGIIIILIFIVTFLICLVFDRLKMYKNEISRVLILQNNKIEILINENKLQFNRLNKLESVLQEHSETLDYFKYRDSHEY